MPWCRRWRWMLTFGKLPSASSSSHSSLFRWSSLPPGGASRGRSQTSFPRQSDDSRADPGDGGRDPGCCTAKYCGARVCRWVRSTRQTGLPDGGGGTARRLSTRCYTGTTARSPGVPQVHGRAYPDRLEIKSPGALFGPVTVEDLGQEGVSSSRNSFLAQLPVRTTFVPQSERLVAENRASGISPTMILRASALRAGATDFRELSEPIRSPDQSLRADGPGDPEMA